MVIFRREFIKQICCVSISCPFVHKPKKIGMWRYPNSERLIGDVERDSTAFECDQDMAKQ